MILLVKNVSGEEIPAHAVMIATGVERLANDRIAVEVNKPGTDTGTEANTVYIINGTTPLGLTGASRYGHGRIPDLNPLWMAYDSTSGTPAFGDEYGPPDGSWRLDADGDGFYIYGLPDVETQRVLAGKLLDNGLRIIRFRITSVTTQSDASTDGEAEATVLNTSCGSTENDDTVTLHDPLRCILDEAPTDLVDREGFAARMKDPDSDGCRYEIIALCCPPE